MSEAGGLARTTPSPAAGGGEAPVLEAREVHKSYGRTRALEGVSIDVRPGEFVALLGPNGAGKSTLFQLLTGLFVCDQGSIRIAGHDLRKAPVRALAAIGVVFQQPTLDLDLSVRANLRFHLRLHGIDSAWGRARMAAALERMGLTGSAKALCRTLSGGNRRRVELVRGLLHEPAILLMDEPTVGLDPASRRLILDHVHAECRERGLGVLWATHLVDEAEEADRVVVLHRGRVLAEGTPEELRSQAGTPDLASAFLSLTGSGSPDAQGQGRSRT